MGQRVADTEVAGNWQRACRGLKAVEALAAWLRHGNELLGHLQTKAVGDQRL